MRNMFTIGKARELYAPDAALPTFQQDLDFHASITAINHNRLLQQRLGMLKAQISCAFLITRSKPTSFHNLERVFEEHRMIFNAMERRWDDLAENLMRRHISDARKCHFKT